MHSVCIRAWINENGTKFSYLSLEYLDQIFCPPTIRRIDDSSTTCSALPSSNFSWCGSLQIMYRLPVVEQNVKTDPQLVDLR